VAWLLAQLLKVAAEEVTAGDQRADEFEEESDLIDMANDAELTDECDEESEPELWPVGTADDELNR